MHLYERAHIYPGVRMHAMAPSTGSELIPFCAAVHLARHHDSMAFMWESPRTSDPQTKVGMDVCVCVSVSVCVCVDTRRCVSHGVTGSLDLQLVSVPPYVAHKHLHPYLAGQLQTRSVGNPSGKQEWSRKVRS